MAHYAVTVTFTLPTDTDYDADDVRDAVYARLDEIYPNDVAVPENVRVTVRPTDAVHGVHPADNLPLCGTDDVHPATTATDAEITCEACRQA